MSNGTLELACKYCYWVFDRTEKLESIKPHFDEHGTAMDFTIVVLCIKCGQQMEHFATIDRASYRENHYECKHCHRAHVVRQNRKINDG